MDLTQTIKRTHLVEVPVGEVIPPQYFIPKHGEAPRAIIPSDYKYHGLKVRTGDHCTILQLKEE